MQVNKINRKLREEDIINFIFFRIGQHCMRTKILLSSTVVDKILKYTCNVYIITVNVLSMKVVFPNTVVKHSFRTFPKLTRDCKCINNGRLNAAHQTLTRE